MIYDLAKTSDVVRLDARLAKLKEKGASVELKDKTIRTLSQNAYLHLIIGVLAMETGNTLEYTKEMYFKRGANADIFVVKRHDELLGDIEYLRSSADIDKDTMTKCIDRFKRFASEYGYILPEANEDKLLEDVQRQMEMRRGWL